MTVKLSQERKVRSLAKKTLGSMRVGRAMRLPVLGGKGESGLDLEGFCCWGGGWVDGWEGLAWGGLEERL
jgi:hypothetical protein